jgi:response regulator NasT
MTSTTTSESRALRVLIADEREEALARLRDALEALGHHVTAFAVSVGEAVEAIAEEDPDLSFVMVHEDDEHALALISETVASASGPVIAHVGGADRAAEFVEQAAERGISAYVSTTDPGVIQGAIEVAMRRHAETGRLEEKVEQLEDALERRSTIERAKGILMERHSIGEREAFGMLRDHARSSGRRVVDVAFSVVDGHALLPGTRA